MATATRFRRKFEVIDTPSLVDIPRQAAPDGANGSSAPQAPTEVGPTPTELILRYARAQRDTVRWTEASARRGDPEAVHDMRVAIRRLRSTLRTFGGLWDLAAGQWLRAELKWLADRLGPVRDAQVMADRLAAAVEAEPDELVVGPVAANIQRALDADLVNGQRHLRAALDTERYRDLLECLDTLLDGGDRKALGSNRKDLSDEGAPGAKWLRQRTRKALLRAEEMLADAVRHRNSEPGPAADGKLHEARKAYKRARYAVEVSRPAVGKPARRLAARLAMVQDILGAHQDAVITGVALRGYAGAAEGRGESTFTYGLLHARQSDAGERGLVDLPAAQRAAAQGRVRAWLG